MLKLAHVISDEQSVDMRFVMLIRHSAGQLQLLRRYGVSLDDYTSFQPKGRRFDFHDDRYHAVCRLAIVVLRGDAGVDVVWGVFRVGPECTDGLNTQVGFVSPAYRNFQLAKGKTVVLRRFSLTRELSEYEMCTVSGYEGREVAAALHFNNDLFHQIHLGSDVGGVSKKTVEYDFATELLAAEGRATGDRLRRLALASEYPLRVAVRSYVYKRNADVVAEVLFRAGGVCGKCRSPAPFPRNNDGRPFLEVHHKLPLASGGKDTVENAIALCPNCHRRFHFGDWADQVD